MRLRTIVAVALLVPGLGLLTVAPTFADDHLFTAVAAGGLTTSSQPFTNTGIGGANVPGQGSPLSGSDHTVPAVGTDNLRTTHANPGNGVVRTPGAVQQGRVAPSANSPHPGP